MSVKQCTECMGEIPKKAKRCQHCSAKVKQNVGLGGTIIVIFIIFWAMGFVVDKITGADKMRNIKPKYENTDNRVQAHVCAQMNIENKLKLPSSAKFVSGSFRDTTHPIGENIYVVGTDVEAKNSFNAIVITSFLCRVEYLKAEDACNTECYDVNNSPTGWKDKLMEEAVKYENK